MRPKPNLSEVRSVVIVLASNRYYGHHGYLVTKCL